MGNSFKFIYILIIILVIMIVVSLGLFIMIQSQGFINSLEIGSNEVSEFNSKWTNYYGIQKGSTLKGLLKKLAQNAEENIDNPIKLIDVAYNISEGSKFIIINSTVKNPNIASFNEAVNKLSVSHAYIVEFIYNENTGIISGIIIKNSRNDKPVNFIPDET